MSATISTFQPVHPSPQRTRRHHAGEAGGPTSAVRSESRRGTPRRVSEATYRRRRTIVGSALAAFVAVGAVTAHDVLAGSGGVPASAAVSQPARQTVVAHPGDTLWAIADRYRGDVSITRYVDKLVALNGGATIRVGQAVVLP